MITRVFVCFILLNLCFSSFAQDTNEPPVLTNKLVNFKPDNYPYTGVTNYPIPGPLVDYPTNAPGWATNMTTDQYAAYLATIYSSPAWINGKSNANWIANNKRTLNLQKIAALFDLLPSGWTNCASDKATSDIIEASLASGTNTQAQVVVRIRQLNGITQNAINRQQKVLELWWRMELVLRAIYDPIKDQSP